MNPKSRGAAGWLPLLIIVVGGLSACGGGSSGGSSGGSGAGGGGAGGPPPPPPNPGTPAPSALSYAAEASYNVGAAITPLDPTVTGTVTSYGVTPALPAGLSLDTTTGRISGTPTAPSRSTHTITATNAGGNTTFALTISVVGERSTTDRLPDEKTGNQVHVMYVLPSDATVDEQLDRNGTLEASLKIANEWFKTQTGGPGLRFDTYGGGKLDVTFLKAARTDVQMNVAGGNVRVELEEQLLRHGFDDPDKAYLVYYGGDGDGCGRGAWPPNLPGNVGALYIGAAAGCTAQPFATGDQPPGFLEFLAVHETLHVLGFAADCAPNHSETGHVDDSVQDLMFSGGAWRPSMLDVNHDDYFGPIADCRDLANSAFLDPLPASAESPPGWPYETLEDLGCLNELATIPGPLGAETQITFVNAYDAAPEVSLFERRPDATQPSGYARVFVRAVAYNDGYVLRTQENAVIIVHPPGGCRYLLRATAGPTRFIID